MTRINNWSCGNDINYGIDDNDAVVKIANGTFASSFDATKLCNEGTLLLLRGGININSNNSTYVSNKIVSLQ